MFTFFRRLIGTDPIQRAVNRRFRNGLNGFDKRAEEIEGIEGQLASIISTVEKKQDSLRAARRTDMSGEHRLNLAVGGSFEEQEPGTS